MPVGALLSAFATPRTSLRLWGDTAFDPLGGGLAALGIAVCLRALRFRPELAALLVFLAVGVLPGFLSSYDRPSLGRMFVSPVPLALLAGLGFELLRQGLLPRARGVWLGWATACAIAASRFFLFDAVNPRILAPSSVGLALRALADDPPAGGALFLQHGPPFDFACFQVRPIAQHVPAEPLPVFDYAGAPSLAPATQGAPPPAEVLFWSAGLEEDGHVGSVICRFWPKTALCQIEDPAGRSRTYAARASGPAWRPSERGLRFRMRSCGRLGRPGAKGG